MASDGPFTIYDFVYLAERMRSPDGGCLARGAGMATYTNAGDQAQRQVAQAWLDTPEASNVWIEALGGMSPTDARAIDAAISTCLGRGPSGNLLVTTPQDFPEAVLAAGRRVAGLLGQRYLEAHPAHQHAPPRRFGVRLHLPQDGNVAVADAAAAAAAIPVGGDDMLDDDIDISSVPVRGEGKPVFKQARTEATPGGASSAGGADETPGGMKISRTLSEQMARVGVENLFCASCQDHWCSEKPSPHSDWRWWGAKANVKGFIKKAAGTHFSLTFYLCAECRRLAWHKASESASYMPDWMSVSAAGSANTTDGYSRVNCEALAVHAARNLLNRNLEELVIDSVWVESD